MSSVEQIEHFTGFGLYDKSFVQVMRDLKDPIPFLRGVVGELGFKRTEIEYTQAQRRAGKTHNNFFTLYDAAMLSFTSYTKLGLRLATFVGGFFGLVSIIVGIVYLVLKLVYWNRFSWDGSSYSPCQHIRFITAYIHRSYGRIYIKYEPATYEQTISC